MTRSGQAMMLAMLLLALLFLTVPVMIYMSQAGTRHQVAIQRTQRGRAIAEEGIAYIAHEINTPALWTAALANAATFAGTDCNSTTPIPSISGGYFTVSCMNTDPAGDPDFRPQYQIVVIATATLPVSGGLNQAPAYKMKAFLSVKTLGAALPGGFHASGALELVHVPQDNTGALGPPETNALTVHWGPIVVLDADPQASLPLWSLYDPLNKYTIGANTPFIGFPRKFYSGPMTGNGSLPGGTPNLYRAPLPPGASDEKEYWAGLSLGFPAQIDEIANPPPDPNAYQTIAQGYTTMPTVGSGAGVTGVNCIGTCTVGTYGQNAGTNPPGSLTGDYVVDSSVGDHLQFDNNFNPPAGTIVYVEGDAEFDNVAMNLGSNGAFIVTGNLTLNTNTNGLLATTQLNVPPTAQQEYLYWPTAYATQWPCSGSQGVTCAASAAGALSLSPAGSKVNFKGFLMAKTSLVVAQPNWIIDGAVLVGDVQANSGLLIINTGAPQPSLTVFYDDIINHNIHVQRIELQADKMVAVSG